MEQPLTAATQVFPLSQGVNGSKLQCKSLVFYGGCGLGTGVDRLSLAHDSRCWILLFWTRSSKVCSVADMAVIDVYCSGIVSGTSPVRSVDGSGSYGDIP
jgi:hypothetical protein